jgi:hypothetical protein
MGGMHDSHILHPLHIGHVIDMSIIIDGIFGNNELIMEDFGHFFVRVVLSGETGDDE